MPFRKRTPVRRTASRGKRPLRRTTIRKRAATPRRKPFVKRGRPLKKKTGELVARSARIAAAHTAENFLGGSKKPMPAWFKTLSRFCTPSKYTGAFVGQIFNNANNTKVAFTHWLHRGVMEIQDVITNVGNNSQSTPTENSYKQYMVAFNRMHEWRNSMNTSAHMELYVLQPRRDIALQQGIQGGASGTANRIAPTASKSSQVGAFLVNPTLWLQGVTSTSGGGDVALGPDAGMTSTDQSATPYQCAPITQQFKVRPLKVRWPNGQVGHKGTLEAGETLRLQVTRRMPFMVSYNKFGLTGAQAASIDGTYECLTATPLIMGFLAGTLVHDASSTSTIGTGQSRLDYSSQTRWEQYDCQIFTPTSNHYTTAFSSITTPEQVVPVTGAITTVSAS